MTSNSTTTITLLDDSTQTLNIITSLLTVLGLAGNLISLGLKMCLQFVIPPTWKIAIILGDVANVILGIGLSLFLSHASNQSLGICNAAGFFLLLAILDCLTSGLLSVIILQYIQNPVKISHFSNYSKSFLFILIIPPKLLAICASFLPFIPVDYFDISSDYPLSCFPLRQSGAKSAEYSAVLFITFWSILIATVCLCIMCAFRLWRSSLSRIHASSPDLWQTQLLSQGKTLQKFLLLEQTIWVITLFLLTLILYTNSTKLLVPQWIVYVALSVVTTLHCIFSHLETGLWSTLCCSSNRKSKEPYQRLKKLELIKVEGTSKLRMKASWSLHKGVIKTGMLKVYGINYVKSWSQEIVILGMLRKCHHPSILQCLWTSTSNPFFETMTLISGQIITSDSRLICMELTNGGCLHQFLQDLDIPLPEACQQTILHDVAEGLSCLHEQNIIHNNLSSFSIYLKGSIQCLVLRASVGDFENAQIYGSLQSGSSSSTSANKKQFFLPDIRAFALVALEILGVVCEKKLEVQSHHKKTDFQTLPENGEYFNYERPDSHLSSSMLDSYQLPNQTDLIKCQTSMGKQQRPTSRGSRDNLLAGNKTIPTKSFVEKYISAATSANMTSYASGSKIDCKAGDQTYSSSQILPVRGSSSGNVSHPYVNVQNVTRSKTVDSLPSRNGVLNPHSNVTPFADPIQPNSNLNPHTITASNIESRPLSARSSSHITEQTANTRLENTCRSEPTSSQTQHMPSSLYGNPDIDRDYEEIDDIAECIETEYYRKHMYPPKRQTGIPTYVNNPPPSNLHQANHNVQESKRMPVPSQSNNRGHLFNAAPPEVPKRNNAPSSGQSVNNSECLPGMVDSESVNQSPSLKDLVKAKEAAKSEQHLESYQERINRELLEQRRNPSSRQMLTQEQLRKLQQSKNQIPEWLQPQHVNVDNTGKIEYTSNSENAKRVQSTENQNCVKTILQTPYTETQHNQNDEKTHNNKRSQSAQHVSPKLMNAQEEVVEISCEYQIPTVRVQSAKTTKARSALRKNIHKNSPAQTVLNFDRGKTTVDLETKYSKFQQIGTIRDTFRRLKDKKHNAQHNANIAISQTQVSSNETLMQPHESQKSKPNVPPKPTIVSNKNNNAKIGRFSSFSSSDSFNSSLYKQSPKEGESLTSGEVSSLSSQAEMTSEQLEQNGYITDTAEGVVRESGIERKAVDSGFDTASVNSGVFGAEGYSCACAESKHACTCQYTSTEKSDTKTSWSNTESVTSSLELEQTNDKSCPDVVPHRLTPIAFSPDILGPDEQYPSKRSTLSEQAKNGKQKYREIFSKMHTTSLDKRRDMKKGVASKKYKELAKRGIPLRVSVVSVKQPSDGSDTLTDWSEFDSNYEAEVIEEDPDMAADKEIYSDSDAQEFLDSLDSSSSRSSVQRSQHRGSFRSGSVVNDVIREVPEDSSSACEDESKSFLKTSDGKLVKGFEISSSSASDRPPATENVDGLKICDAERKIDMMFTKPPKPNSPEAKVDSALGLDKNTIRQLVQYPQQDSTQGGYRPPVPVRKGMDNQHVKYAQQMASKINLLRYDDLMPAHVDKFQVLRDKLQTEAKLGTVGVQLLDMIQKCWLHDSPPSTVQLVKQLRCPVTETEL